MKKIAMAVLVVAIFMASLAFACPLPVDVKIQKVVTNRSDIEPALSETLMTRLRSQLRAAFSCQNEEQKTRTSRSFVNVDLVEIIHEGIVSTRVNVATDYGFFSARVGMGYMQKTSREQFEAALEQITKDISDTVCK